MSFESRVVVYVGLACRKHEPTSRFHGAKVSCRLLRRLALLLRSDVKTRTTKHSSAALPGTVDSVEAALLEKLFDQAPDVAFFIKGADGRYLTVNDSLVEIHGLHDKAQVLGQLPCDICPGEFGLLPSAQDAVVLRTGRPLLNHLELHWYAPHKPG